MTYTFTTNYRRSVQGVFAFILLLAVLLPGALLAQANGILRGTVRTADAQPAEQINVALEGTTRGTATDAQGAYVLRGVAPGSYTLVISLLGYEPKRVAVEVRTGETTRVPEVTLAESAQQLREVVVNGARINRFARKQSEYVGKMPLDNIENPQVYATVSKELLTEQLVFSVDDAVRNAPGVQKMWEATGRSGDGGAYYNSRGFIVQSQLRNGVAGSVTNTVDAVNLEKLEVIKGPSATLFGSALTSYGGLINRVTKKPHEQFGGEISYAGGSYGFNRVSADVNTPLNQSKTVAFRLNTAYQYEDNFQDQGFSRNVALAPSLRLQPTQRLTINLDAELYRGRGVGRQVIFFPWNATVAQLGTARADELPLDYRKSYTGNGLAQDSRSTNLFGQVNYQLGAGFTSSTNVSFSRSYSDGMGAYFYLLPDALAPGNAGAAPGANFLVRADQSTRDSRNTALEVQQLFNGDFTVGSLRNRVVLGLDVLRMKSNQLFFGGAFDTVRINAPEFDYTQFNGTNVQAGYRNGTIASANYPITTTSTTYSAFVSDVLNLTERLSVLAALRLDRFDNQGGILYFPVEGYKQTALSPKFGVVFQPVKDRVALFANYQNSFTNKGTAFLDPSGQQQKAKPEQANQVEGGVKLDAAGGKLSATISYYDIRVKNLLRTTPGENLPNAQSQNGTQVSKGVELSLIANPFEGFNAVAGFGYNDSKLTRTSPDDEGRRPATAAAPVAANLWLSYRLPDHVLKGLGFGFGGNYASENKVLNSASKGVFTLPSYTVLNASAFYDFHKFRLSAKVDNLTNQRYWIGYTTINPQKLRSAVGSITYKF